MAKECKLQMNQHVYFRHNKKSETFLRRLFLHDRLVVLAELLQGNGAIVQKQRNFLVATLRICVLFSGSIIIEIFWNNIHDDDDLLLLTFFFSHEHVLSL